VATVPAIVAGTLRAISKNQLAQLVDRFVSIVKPMFGRAA
jgi:hypothetical protein